MKRLHSILFGLAFVFFFVPTISHALTVSPARFEISGDPGQTLRGEIVLFEEGGQELSKPYYITYENFEPRGDSGAPYFIGSKDGLATWIYSSSEVTVSQSETIVPFSISIPSNAKPGGYFGAIFFGTQSTNQESQVSVGGKVGVLILLRVNGDIEEGGGLISFGVKGKGHFVVNHPIVLEYRFNNTGGDRVVPRGTISVRNTFRFKTDEKNANDNEGSVLPGSSRRFEVSLSDGEVLGEDDISHNFFDNLKSQLKDFRFGWYTAKINLSWGEGDQTAEDIYHFFVIPWQALLVILGSLFVLMKILKFLLQRYNRWILAQAGFYQSHHTTEVKNKPTPVEETNPIVVIPENKNQLEDTLTPLEKNKIGNKRLQKKVRRKI